MLLWWKRDHHNALDPEDQPVGDGEYVFDGTLFLREFDRVEDHQELYSPRRTDKTLYGDGFLSLQRIAGVCVAHWDRAQRPAPKRDFVHISLCNFEFRLGA